MVVSLFPRADSGSPLPNSLRIGDRVMVNNYVAKVIDRVCPHCFPSGPPFPSYFEIAGGDFKGCRWCPEHMWVNRQRVCHSAF